jgi:hypothetical protein
MTKGWKIVLSIVGVLFLLVIVGVAVTYHYGQQFLAQQKDQIEELRKVAVAYGQKNDNSGCLQEALRRVNLDSSITGRGYAQGFLRLCLDNSQPTPRFCDGVPRVDEIVKSVQWRMQYCEKLQIDPQKTQLVIGGIQFYCEKQPKALASNQRRETGKAP